MLDHRLERRVRLARRSAAGTAAIALGLIAALPALALAPSPLGPQFQINSYTTNDQGDAHVAAAADGVFVVVWTSRGSFGSDSSYTSIQGQRYASDGAALGAQFQINSYTTLAQHSPSVAAAPNGDFVVAWESFRSSGTDTSFASIQGQRFASNGATLGGQFQVNSYTTEYQRAPELAVSPNGDFVVVWTSRGSPGTDSSIDSIQGQRFASNGSTLGVQFQVNTFTTNYQRTTDVATQPDGAFVVVWASYGSSGTDHSGESIQGQRYSSDGSPQGTQFQVNTYTTYDQFRPSIAADSDGGFIVIWPGAPGISARRYDSGGSALGDPFWVAPPPPGGGWTPAIAVAPGGNWLAAWTTQGAPGTDTSSDSVQAQGFAPNDSPQGTPFQVNTYTQYSQNYPDVAAASERGFIVVWTSQRATPGNDTFTDSIQGQRYGTLASVPSLSPSLSFALVAALLLAGVCLVRMRTLARSRG